MTIIKIKIESSNFIKYWRRYPLQINSGYMLIDNDNNDKFCHPMYWKIHSPIK